MTLYENWIGIDIGKAEFEVNLHGVKATKSYTNDDTGIKRFLSANKSALEAGLSILEATGGYEMRLLLSLQKQGLAVHRANARKVKHFIYSYTQGAKTDKLDAKALARYGNERESQLGLFTPTSEKGLELYELVQRRADLRQMLVAEKNRVKAPRLKYVKASCVHMVNIITEELASINKAINHLIKKDESLSKRQEVLETISGIGKIVASELLAMMPELGQMNRRQAAALAGVAPRANDSGRFKGYRSVSAGRSGIKPMLFIAAMAASRSHSPLKAFYEQLVARGKKKMVALVALMRKIIIIANARLKEAAI